jgi:hypothetical protein
MPDAIRTKAKKNKKILGKISSWESKLSGSNQGVGGWEDKSSVDEPKLSGSNQGVGGWEEKSSVDAG